MWTRFVDGSPSSAAESVAAEYRPKNVPGWIRCCAGSGTGAAGACATEGEVGSGGVRAGADDVVGGDVVGDASISIADMDTKLGCCCRRHEFCFNANAQSDYHGWVRGIIRIETSFNLCFECRIIRTVSDLDSDLNSPRVHVSDRAV